MKRAGLWICIVTGIGLGLAPVGCTSNTGEAVDTPHPTLIEVDPELFLKDVPCGTEPGALQTYVATLYDMTPIGAGGAATEGPDFIELPSSGPVPCTRPVAFTFVVPGHAYAARIQGYARSADELEQPEPGIPILVVPGTRTTVPPDWTANCGAPPGGEETPSGADPAVRVVSQYQATRKVQPCDDWTRHGRETPTSVVVGLDAATCAELDIEAFTLRRNGAEIGGARCGETIELGRPHIEAGQFVELELLAYTAGASSPALGALCTAKVLSGVRVLAACEELASAGSIRVEVRDVLASMGASCSDAVDVVLSIPGSTAAPIRLGRESCRGVATFFDLAPGPYDIRAESMLLSRSVSCLATVEPGLSAVAACTANP